MGEDHPDRLLERITSAQFVEWLAFYRLDPWGGERGDVQAGVVASTLANIHRDTKKKTKPFTVQDFMPFVDRPKKNPLKELRSYLRGMKDGQ